MAFAKRTLMVSPTPTMFPPAKTTVGHGGGQGTRDWGLVVLAGTLWLSSQPGC